MDSSSDVDHATSSGWSCIVDLESRFAAMRCVHIKQLIVNYGSARWHVFARFWIGLSLRQWNPDFLSNTRPHSFDRPPFYSAALSDFRRLMSICPDFPIEQIKVKSVYRCLLSERFWEPRVVAKLHGVDLTSTWSVITRGYLSPRPREVTWRLAHQVLPVRVMLYRFKITNVASCGLCGSQPETLDHLFLQCHVVQPIWSSIRSQLGRLAGCRLVLNDRLIFYFQWPSNIAPEAKAPLSVLFSELLYSIWIKRNEAIYRKTHVDTRSIVVLFMHRLRTRIKADFIRFTMEQFRAVWCYSNVLADVENDELVLFI